MEFNEIQLTISQNKNAPAWVGEAREKHKQMAALVDGKNFKDLLIKIEHKEDEEKQKARKRYARSTKDMFTRILRPIDNVYSATGGSKKYDTKNKEVVKKIATIRDGKTLEKWLQVNWMHLYHTDPNGVIMYEWDKDNLYPTYKSIDCIRSYSCEGQKLKWILFEPENKQGVQTFRFIDEAKDYTITVSGESITINEEKTYLNPFGVCPGIIISDIVEIGTMKRCTPIDDISEISNEYLRDQSIKSIFKFLHGFPIFWRYAVQCDRCSGLGKIEQEGTTSKATCPDCDGLGYYMKKDVTDAVTLPIPVNNDDVKVAPDIAGFINPPLDIWDQFNKELKILEEVMYETLWGSYVEKGTNETATGRWIDTQPVINKLNVYADEAEWVEWYMSELAMRFITKSKDTNKSLCTILYGRNYIIEPNSVILEKYEKARSQGDNTSILDKLLEEWLLSKFKTDPETLAEELNRIKIEPFVHYTVKEVKDVFGEQKAQEKMLFSTFWLNEDKVGKTKEQLSKSFINYLKQNQNGQGV